MTEISSNYFFTFKSKIKYLIEDIENKAFSPRYYCEDFEYLHPAMNSMKIYILMKCFCDIPLKLMKKHINKYGSYGIGLKKDWGLKNNLTPLHYIPVLSKNAWYQSNLLKLYSLVFSYQGDPDIRECLINYFIFTKPYQQNETVFYDEREWRYVPSLENLKRINGNDLRIQRHFLLPNNNEKEFLNLNVESDNLKNNEYSRLSFELNDIKYLIVKEENEVDQIRDLISGFSSIEIKSVSNIEMA